MNRSITLVCVLFGLAPAAFRPASAEEPSGVRNVFERVSGGFSAGFYDATNDRWLWQGPVIVSSTALASYFAYRMGDATPSGSSPSPRLGATGRWISDIGGYAGYALPAGVLAAGLLLPRDSSDRRYTLDTAQQLLESFAFTWATTFALKVTVGRGRPYGDNGRSFPSGHTSLAFSSASVLAYRYPWYIGVPALMAASAVGMTRVDLGRHHVSDVLVGAGIGFFFATSVHRYHAARRPSVRTPSSRMLVPLIGDDTFGLALAAVF